MGITSTNIATYIAIYTSYKSKLLKAFFAFFATQFVTYYNLAVCSYVVI